MDQCQSAGCYLLNSGKACQFAASAGKWEASTFFLLQAQAALHLFFFTLFILFNDKGRAQGTTLGNPSIFTLHLSIGENAKLPFAPEAGELCKQGGPLHATVTEATGGELACCL